MSEDIRTKARTREGIVTSCAPDKSAVVSVKRRIKHPRYHKFLELNKKYLVHDERNECEVGDRVRIYETRPLSKRKRYRLREILEKAVKDVQHD